MALFALEGGVPLAEYQDSQLYAGEPYPYAHPASFNGAGCECQRSGRAAWNDPVCGVTPVKFAEIK